MITVAVGNVRNFSGEIVNNVFARWQWVPFGELQVYDIPEGNRDVIRKLVERYAAA